MGTYEEAKERIPKIREVVENMLIVSGNYGVSNVEFTKILGARRWSGRIGEMRDEGYIIDAIPKGKGVYRYYLRMIPYKKLIKRDAKEIFVSKMGEKYGTTIQASEVLSLLNELNLNIVRKGRSK
jgi:hypothetical protein